MNEIMLGMLGTPGERAFWKYENLQKENRLPKRWGTFEKFIKIIGCPINTKQHLHYPREGELTEENTFWSSAGRSQIYFISENGDKLTIKQLAKSLGVSRQRVDQKYQKALELGVDPLSYITKKHKKGDPSVGEYERFFDGEIHTLEFTTERKAEAFCHSIKSYYTVNNPDGKFKTRRLENVVLMKFSS